MVSRQLPRNEVCREEKQHGGKPKHCRARGGASFLFQLSSRSSSQPKTLQRYLPETPTTLFTFRLGMIVYQHNRDDKFRSPKHPAVVVFTSRAPFKIMEVDTIPPTADEAIVYVEWIGPTPLKLQQTDGGLI